MIAEPEHYTNWYPENFYIPVPNNDGVPRVWDGRNWIILPLTKPMGCICPPTSEKTCQNPMCPRLNPNK